jgi:hypothetical protein
MATKKKKSGNGNGDSGSSSSSGSSGSGGSKSKTSGTFQIIVQNRLGESKNVGGQGASVDNTMDATQVNRPIDADSFEDALNQATKLCDAIPDKSRAYDIRVVEIATGKSIAAEKETNNVISAIKEVIADLKDKKITPETDEELVERQAQEATGKKKRK